MEEPGIEDPRTVAYFSMEIALASDIPTYSGGLGVLAGDTVRAGADLGTPMVAVTLLCRAGYFQQRLDATGAQTEAPVVWDVEAHLRRLPVTIEVAIEGRAVTVGAWQYNVVGESGAIVPVLLLDTDVAGNAAKDRRITDQLYGGDDAYRLRQEVVLGIGGVRALAAAGYANVSRFHMNEGHASLLVLELMRREAEADPGAAGGRIAERVRQRCIFTTHTPVEAGHDRFPMALARKIVGAECLEPFWSARRNGDGAEAAELNMTELGFTFSRFINGVAKRHGAFTRQLFRGYTINSITNGVHARTWVSPPFAELFDAHIPDWRLDAYSLRSAAGIDLAAIRAAHETANRTLTDHVNRVAGVPMDPDVFTIGFARRATAYKRAELLVSDPNRLLQVAKAVGPLQVVFAGKAHPRDTEGKAIIRRIFQAARRLRDRVRIVFLPNYDMRLCGQLIAGCDLWLNTPRPPMEASGTSGMKAALNGVPSLSTMDGWWIEGCLEGVTGWAIGEDRFPRHETADPAGPADTAHADATAADDAAEAASMYDKLEDVILPMYYGATDEYARVMRHAIAINGAFFHTQRMMSQYVAHAYFT